MKDNTTNMKMSSRDKPRTHNRQGKKKAKTRANERNGNTMKNRAFGIVSVRSMWFLAVLGTCLHWLAQTTLKSATPPLHASSSEPVGTPSPIVTTDGASTSEQNNDAFAGDDNGKDIGNDNDNVSDKSDQHLPSAKMSQFILHIGPPKTATTTIQADLHDLQKENHLLEDGYVYYGATETKYKYKDHALTCLDVLKSGPCLKRTYPAFLNNKRTHVSTNRDIPYPLAPECALPAKMMLDQLRDDGKSVILSDEEYAHLIPTDLLQTPAFLESFRDVLQGWNITMVATYRRTADWMLSSLKQNHASHMMGGNVPHNKWPVDGGAAFFGTMPSFRAWMRHSRARWNSKNGGFIAAKLFRDFIGATQGHRNNGFRIHVLNFHDKHHVTKQLLCDFIQDAPMSCQRLQEKTERSENSRNLPYFLYNNIVFAAAERNIIDAATQVTNTRGNMTNVLVTYHRDTLGKSIVDLPLACPPDAELEDILAMSLSNERLAMPEWAASPGVEEAHRASFHRMAYEKRLFCDINMDRLFEGVTTWDGLLERMKAPW